MFLSKNKKNNVYPSKPQFYCIKVGFKGSKLYSYVFVMIHFLDNNNDNNNNNNKKKKKKKKKKIPKYFISWATEKKILGTQTRKNYLGTQKRSWNSHGTCKQSIGVQVIELSPCVENVTKIEDQTYCRTFKTPLAYIHILHILYYVYRTDRHFSQSDKDT